MLSKYKITVRTLIFFLLFYLGGMEIVPGLATSPLDIRIEESFIRTGDNTNSSVGALGYFDGGGSVGIAEIAALARAYGLKAGKPGYQESFDLNLDGNIDLYDLVILAKRYSEVKIVQYGIVTEIVSLNNVSHHIIRVKVLTENGNEAVFDINENAVKLAYEEGNHEMEAGDFIEYTHNASDSINSLTLLARQTETGMTIPTGPEGYVDQDNNKYLGVIQYVDPIRHELKFNDRWCEITDNTKVFNGYGEIGNEANHKPSLINPQDLLDWAYEIPSKNFYIQFNDRNNITYIYFCHDIPKYRNSVLTTVLDYYTVNDNPWVDVDIKGEIHSHELNNQSYSPMVGALYQYSIDNNKINLTGDDVVFDPNNATICSSAYGFVFGKSSDQVKINGVSYYLNEKTVIYDYSSWYQNEENPEYWNEYGHFSKYDMVWYKTWNEDSPYLKILILSNGMKEHFDWDIPIPMENNYVMITDKYYISGDLWVDLDINGVIYSYEVGGTYVPIVGSLYRNYAFNEDKIIISASDFVFNPDDFKDSAVLSSDPGAYGSISGKVFAVVTDINEISNAIQINGVWYYINEDTYIFDYSDWYDDGDEPEYLDRITDINKGDSIIFVSIPYLENLASLLLIVNNIPNVDLPAIINDLYPDDYISNENKWDDVDTYDTIKEDKIYPPIPNIFD